MGKQILLVFKSSNVTACEPSQPLELKDLIFCNKSWYGKIKFLETIHRKKLCWKETYTFVTAHLAFFSFISFESTIIHLKISLNMFFIHLVQCSCSCFMLSKVCIFNSQNYLVIYPWSLYFSYSLFLMKKILLGRRYDEPLYIYL